MSTFKPCPFCGVETYTGVEIHEVPHIGISYSVKCEACKVNGPHADNVKDAIEKWNRRPNPTDQMRRRLEIAEDDRRGESWRAILKMGEEFGELCEAVLVDYGSLAYKNKEVSTIDECADILNAVAAFLGRHYPDLSADEIMSMLEQAGDRKIEKYLTVVRSKLDK
jgi:Lar family restriction alleviation protein